MSAIEKSVFIADLASRVECYGVTIDKLITVALEKKLSPGELMILTKAYNEVIRSLLESWNIFVNIENRDLQEYNKIQSELLYTHKFIVGDEIVNHCETFITLLDTQFINTPKESATHLQIKGKLFWYITDVYRAKVDFLEKAEVKEEVDEEAEKHFVGLTKKAKEDAEKAYEKAVSKAATTLLAAHPTRLEISLVAANFALLVLKNRDRAAAIAQDAIDKAVDTHMLEEKYVGDSRAVLDTLLFLNGEIKSSKGMAALLEWINNSGINKPGLGEHLAAGPGVKSSGTKGKKKEKKVDVEDRKWHNLSATR